MIRLHSARRRLLPCIALLAFLSAIHGSYASDVNWIGPDLGSWNTAVNWSSFIAPDATFNQAGVINNNTTAVLSATAMSQGAPVNVGGLRLGSVASSSGGLRITNGGNLPLVAASSETGAAQIGLSGEGILTILGGGTLTARSITSGGNATSSITLGDSSGLIANVAINGTANFQRITNIRGQNVNFSTTGNLTLSSAHTLNGEIRHATLHSPLKSGGTASISGTFKPTFVGVTPSLGNRWTLIDAANITGNFATIDTSAAPALPVGAAYQVIPENGGTNGRLLRLSVEEVLVLQAHRTTGAVSIANVGTSAKQLDGYSIFSANGSLTGSWNSLQDQAVPGWVESAPTATALSELNPQGSTTINSSGSLNLGTPYQVKFPAFGQDPDELAFEYRRTDGRIIQGSVTYSGTKVVNDLILTVQPATGQVQLKNDSPYDIFINGYSVSSASGSLVPVTWNSLEDQAVVGWQEAGNLTANGVSEQRSGGFLRLTAGSGFNLGALAKNTGTGLVQDLQFDFLQQGMSTPTAGQVFYGAFGAIAATTPGVLGDYNNDGSVNAADYIIWRNAQGTNTVLRNDPTGGMIGTAQYSQWRAQFGNSTSGASSSLSHVPEPAICASLLLWFVALVVTRAGGYMQRRKDRCHEVMSV